MESYKAKGNLLVQRRNCELAYQVINRNLSIVLR